MRYAMLIKCYFVGLLTLLSIELSTSQGNYSLPEIHRSTRQISCRSDEHLCQLGTFCIKHSQVCDGQVDCADSSDESFTLCSQDIYKCPEFAFRCSYGACVDGDAKCNGVTDCADQSDELLPECEGVVSKVADNQCHDVEFACLSGTQCIENHRRCDGTVDCDDGTDETITECSQIECEPFSFRCAYGACIDGDLICDGQSSCKDGSDELSPNCTFQRPAVTQFQLVATTQPSVVPVFFNNKTTVTARPRPVTRPGPTPPTTFVNPNRRGCKLPAQPESGFYKAYVCEESPDIPDCQKGEGSKVGPGFSLHFECNEGFARRGAPDIVCRSNGRWSQPVPTCSDKCEPLISKKLLIICLTESRDSIPCNTSVPGNTRASFRCDPSTHMKVKEPGYNKINCKNGEWDRPLIEDFCQPECGRPLSDLAQPAVSNGKITEYGQFPWHAGIYERKNKTYQQICGGTLISPKVVISAAHCFWYEKTGIRDVFKKNIGSIKVAVGKYKRDLYAVEDTLAQIRDVRSIQSSPEYRGTTTLYSDDIAFIVLKVVVDYTYAVRPICLDLGKESFEEDQLVDGNVGKIVGWGLTREQVASETLLLAEIPYVSREKCRQTIVSSLLQYVTRDKICAGDKKSYVNVCPGDSGGGLVFEDPKTHAYYLRGIVSLGSKGCKGQEYALFTRLSSHKEYVEKYFNM